MEKDIFKQRRQMLADMILNNELYVPMKAKEIAMLLDIPKAKRSELMEVLDSLVADGTIGVSKKGKYMKPENVALVGTFESTSRGFGFVVIPDREDDIFVKANDTMNAFYHDKVKVVITTEKNGGKRAEGKIVAIVEHEVKEVVGTFQKNRTYGFVIPDNAKINCDIFIPQEFMNGAVEGSKVVASISDYGSQSKNPQGKVTEVLGHIDDPGVDIMSIIKAYDLPVEFPESVKKAINDIPDVVSEKDKAGRVDLRNVQMVTIDGEDAKDLDDAVSISKEGPVYHLGVHIADVSHYVTEGSALDKEALKRGTSVYLVDRVIPMIPHKLSNGICSLNQGEDRLALSCLMDIDEKGNIVGHRICETVINVDRRMSYTSVKKILVDNDTNEIMKYKELVPMFHMMEEAAELLRKKRFARGSVDFDFPESKIILDENGHPTDIKPYDRNVATKIIEDFMLAANETVAEDYFWQDMPFLYRTHENPDPEKMRKLATFINNFGYTLRLTDDLRPKEIQKLLSEIEGSDAENLISRLTLRSMKKAKYTTECVGHFGLAAKYYCHFTSPIRRYPDLQIHRIIKENLHGGLSPKRADHYDAILPDVAVQTSAMERRAADAERDTDKLKMAEYMEQFVGETFDGVVSGVTAWGVYVERPNTIEGMVSVNNMKGFYTFDEEHYEMVGELGNRSYKLGQKVKVVVIGTDKILRTIDLHLHRIEWRLTWHQKQAHQETDL
ncbi:MAG: ribonuclease R [Eubacterium sp.]